MDIFSSQSLSLLNKSLDGLWKRQEIISDNVANYETPGYKRKYVSFEENLKAAVESGSATKSQSNQKIMDADIKVGQTNDETMRTDGNNVDIEEETIEMARTTLNYLYSQRMLDDYFSRLRCAISEGSK
ncbi:MAG TPA: flagellar basal body rod protein FlgB [Clostridiales bacterium]|nr:flagellar basal body rod protein FlgB [Clostridiales bacterium]